MVPLVLTLLLALGALLAAWLLRQRRRRRACRGFFGGLRYCPFCDSLQTAVRWSTSLSQAMLGGVSCGRCGAELEDREHARDS